MTNFYEIWAGAHGHWPKAQLPTIMRNILLNIDAQQFVTAQHFSKY